MNIGIPIEDADYCNMEHSVAMLDSSDVRYSKSNTFKWGKLKEGLDLIDDFLEGEDVWDEDDVIEIIMDPGSSQPVGIKNRRTGKVIIVSPYETGDDKR